MSNFEVAIQTVFVDEGDFVDDPKDSGGATKYGISLMFLKNLNELPAELGFQVINKKTIQQLTREQAILLYRNYFWNPHGYERILDQRIATKIFDFTVNAGSHASHTCLQWALRATGNSDIRIDGVLGHQTIQMINSVDARVLLAALRSEMAGYYRLLKQPHFEAGWLKRAYT
jgi:lysozyme family protein